MDIGHAKELLTTLADGVNPLTGEILSENDSCNQVEIVRALYAVLQYIDNADNKPNKTLEKSLPENAGKPWTKEDEDALCQMFDSGYTQKEISSHFKRSRGAIAARLVKLGRISDRNEFK